MNKKKIKRRTPWPVREYIITQLEVDSKKESNKLFFANLNSQSPEHHPPQQHSTLLAPLPIRKALRLHFCDSLAES